MSTESGQAQEFGNEEKARAVDRALRRPLADGSRASAQQRSAAAPVGGPSRAERPIHRTAFFNCDGPRLPSFPSCTWERTCPGNSVAPAAAPFNCAGKARAQVQFGREKKRVFPRIHSGLRVVKLSVNTALTITSMKTTRTLCLLLALWLHALLPAHTAEGDLDPTWGAMARLLPPSARAMSFTVWRCSPMGKSSWVDFSTTQATMMTSRLHATTLMGRWTVQPAAFVAVCRWRI